MSAQQTQCNIFDLTWYDYTDDYTHAIKLLKEFCKDGELQLEECPETKKLHFQCRVSLKERTRLSTLCKKKYINNCHWSNTTNEIAKACMAGNWDGYQSKEYSRVAGPWNLKNFEEKYIPRQYREKLDKLYPFQKKIFDDKDFSDRFVKMIYCKSGCQGKSTIAHLCRLFGNGIVLPICNDAEKLIQSTCDILSALKSRQPNPIFIDLPRAMDKTKLRGIYTAVEQIKNGWVYDTRYNFKDWDFDSPNIYVFSNHKPDLTYLSKDRWIIYTIDENRDFQIYKEEKKKEPQEYIDALDANDYSFISSDDDE